MAGPDEIAAIVAEIRAELCKTVPRRQLDGVIASALADLQGFVSDESLPEMTVRLVRVRIRSGLVAQADPGAMTG